MSIPLGEDRPARPCVPVVLVVSADEDWREVSARVLEREGYAVVAVAHSGHALLKGLTSGRLDMVVTDLSMDDISGPALAERLRRHHPRLEALYIAQAGTPECDNVLVRPFTRDDLLERLSTVLTAAS